MSEPAVSIRSIGAEAQPLVTLDGFAPDPDGLRSAAIASRFGAAAHYYPGIRAPLPEDYWAVQRPIVAAALASAFGAQRGFAVIDSSFSIVTRSPAALTMKQRLPHCDAFVPERIAMIHYLSPENTDGTAFFRHRSTGFETIDEDRLPQYRERLDADLRHGPRPSGYTASDTPLFERTAVAEGTFNRALLYRSYLLHSGAIAPDASLSADPANGRLTITAFLMLE